MSKQKQQGTKLETFVAKMLDETTYAEGGKNDKGDVLNFIGMVMIFL